MSAPDRKVVAGGAATSWPGRPKRRSIRELELQAAGTERSRRAGRLLDEALKLPSERGPGRGKGEAPF